MQQIGTRRQKSRARQSYWGRARFRCPPSAFRRRDRARADWMRGGRARYREEFFLKKAELNGTGGHCHRTADNGLVSEYR